MRRTDHLCRGVLPVVCISVCVSNFVFSRDFKNEFSVEVPLTHTKHLLFHAQCFPSYQLVSSPPLPSTNSNVATAVLLIV